ncbi:MAG: hypothetical protein WCK02_07980 [Bacteroidota bacterium]
MSSSFHPLISKTLETARPDSKRKSDVSCSEFYHSLKKIFDNHFREFKNDLITRFKPNERNEYLTNIIEYIHDYIYINDPTCYIATESPSDAEKYLLENDLSIEELFETRNHYIDKDYTAFPEYFNLGFYELKFKTYKENFYAHDLHLSFFTLISDYYIDKLNSFINSLKIIKTNDDNSEKLRFKNVQEIHSYIFTSLSQIELYLNNKVNVLAHYQLQYCFVNLYNQMHQEGFDSELAVKYYQVLNEITSNVENELINKKVDINNEFLKSNIAEIEESKKILFQFLDEMDIIQEDKVHSIFDLMNNDKKNDSSIENSFSSKSVTIEYKHYDSFLKLLKHNWPLESSAFDFINFSAPEKLLNLKNEILENLVYLEKEQKISYFEKLLLNIKLLKKDAWDNDLVIKKWLDKYNSTLEKATTQSHTEDYLNNILRSEPIIRDFHITDDSEIEASEIKNDFYNYFYGQTVDEAIDFIKSQELKLSSISSNNISKEDKTEKIDVGKAQIAVSDFEIKHININIQSIPEIIFDRFRSLSLDVDEKGNAFPPFRASYCVSSLQGDYNFFCLEHNYNLFMRNIQLERLVDDNNVRITEDNVNQFLVSYAKGFYYGYTEFLKSILKSEVFELDNNSKAYKIFERINTAFGDKGDGNPAIHLHNSKITDNYYGYISLDAFYKIGIEGGEYYKAWEIILTDPIPFVPFFEKKKNIEAVVPNSIRMNNQKENNTNKVKTKKPVKKVVNSYTYLKNAINCTAVADMHDTLSKHKFLIADIKDFRAVFEDKKPNSPIKWLDGIESLVYVIKQIHLETKVIENLGSDIWKITHELFVDENGNKFDKSKFRGQKTPSSKSKIDKLNNAIAHLA